MHNVETQKKKKIHNNTQLKWKINIQNKIQMCAYIYVVILGQYRDNEKTYQVNKKIDRFSFC